ncbi:hypothetical protein DJ39_1207 [Yersinia ruckeri ATCC 29473]|uniref:Uncharacterized protein n=1 Tax=Yersinia ruckeri TaxID=29486 RepID=A0A380QL75_YERRU|nr:hypothetical protein QMA0440_02048 [Yersinia ruckeri]KGA50149.1 hypothetical protein DJ39_1207 [Yersinia ruckeri ATCC 29473]KFE40055.1 LPS biosynthesis protein [Yersinia ruckeri]QTD76334.1 Uncharacterized protein YR821_1407 [Yersinia ruckeri]CNA97974.1 Uncharacterised protein [Yersinia ruckeri]
MQYEREFLSLSTSLSILRHEYRRIAQFSPQFILPSPQVKKECRFSGYPRPDYTQNRIGFSLTISVNIITIAM